MYLLMIWMFVGLVVGWLAGKSLEGNGYGPSMDVAMGIAGAVLGGLLMRSMGFSGLSGTIVSTVVAMTCAALLATLTALANGRKIYTRPL